VTAEGSKAVRVTIFGEDYQIRTDLGEDYTRACALHVDDAIQEAHIGSHIAEVHKAAILAAMKITDELFRARRAREVLERALRERLSDLAGRVNAVLDGEES
jgi:cell division protein ZapA